MQEGKILSHWLVGGWNVPRHWFIIFTYCIYSAGMYIYSECGKQYYRHTWIRVNDHHWHASPMNSLYCTLFRVVLIRVFPPCLFLSHSITITPHLAHFTPSLSSSLPPAFPPPLTDCSSNAGAPPERSGERRKNPGPGTEITWVPQKIVSNVWTAHSSTTLNDWLRSVALDVVMQILCFCLLPRKVGSHQHLSCHFCSILTSSLASKQSSIRGYLIAHYSSPGISVILTMHMSKHHVGGIQRLPIYDSLAFAHQ
jgi:hypothetical protein